MGRVIVGVLAAVLLAGCVPGLNSRAGSAIVYSVSGSATAANNVTYSMGSGQQQETSVSLPWSKKFKAGDGFQALVVTAQNAGSGSITCTIIADGKVVSNQTSTGQYAVVTCSGT